MFDSLWPYGLQLSRILCPWNPPGKNTGVGCDAHLLHWQVGSLPLKPTAKPTHMQIHEERSHVSKAHLAKSCLSQKCIKMYPPCYRCPMGFQHTAIANTEAFEHEQIQTVCTFERLLSMQFANKTEGITHLVIYRQKSL